MNSLVTGSTSLRFVCVVVSIAVLLLSTIIHGKGVLFTKHTDVVLPSSVLNLKTQSAIRCCFKCVKDAKCVAVNYEPTFGICAFVETVNIQSMGLTSSLGWFAYVNINPVQANLSTCTSDWFQYEGSCYKIVNIDDTWNNSKVSCEFLGAHMVTIKDANEHQYVYGLSLEYELGDFWIGLRDDPIDNKFKWITGSIATYLKWDEDEPDRKTPQNVLRYDIIPGVTDFVTRNNQRFARSFLRHNAEYCVDFVIAKCVLY